MSRESGGGSSVTEVTGTAQRTPMKKLLINFIQKTIGYQTVLPIPFTQKLE